MGRKLIILGLVLSHCVLLLFAPQWLIWRGPDDYPFWLYVATGMLAHVQGCLLAIWVTLSGRGVAGRACLVTFAITAGAVLLSRLLLQPNLGLMRAWLAAQLLQVLILIPPLLCLRLIGLSLVQSSDEQNSCITRRLASTPLQLVLCTAMAAILTAFPYQLPWRIAIARDSGWGILAQCSIAGVSLLLTWLVLGSGRLVFRGVLCAISLAMVILVSQVPLQFQFAHGACLVISLAAVRLAGIRFLWTTSTVSSQPHIDDRGAGGDG